MSFSDDDEPDSPFMQDVVSFFCANSNTVDERAKSGLYLASLLEKRPDLSEKDQRDLCSYISRVLGGIGSFGETEKERKISEAKFKPALDLMTKNVMKRLETPRARVWTNRPYSSIHRPLHVFEKKEAPKAEPQSEASSQSESDPDRAEEEQDFSKGTTTDFSFDGSLSDLTETLPTAAARHGASHEPVARAVASEAEEAARMVAGLKEEILRMGSTGAGKVRKGRGGKTKWKKFDLVGV